MVRRRDTDMEVGLAVIIFGKIFLTAWLIMLVLGMFAGYMVMPGLAIGYWATMGIVAMLSVALVKLTS